MTDPLRDSVAVVREGASYGTITVIPGLPSPGSDRAPRTVPLPGTLSSRLVPLDRWPLRRQLERWSATEPAELDGAGSFVRLGGTIDLVLKLAMEPLGSVVAIKQPQVGRALRQTLSGEPLVPADLAARFDALFTG